MKLNLSLIPPSISMYYAKSREVLHEVEGEIRKILPLSLSLECL